MSDLDKYIKMQQDTYEAEAKAWTPSNRDPVVGSFDAHNQWADYQTYLFGDIDTSKMSALDFGCGPGRNIVLFNKRFHIIDGADIASSNLAKAEEWLKLNSINIEENFLFLTSGSNCGCALDNSYDMVFSTICMQHICVYTIRFSILKDMFRVLKPGGYVCIQMGYGGKEAGKKWVRYYEDEVDATKTNGGCDISIEEPNDLKMDLEKIGFEDFKYVLRPTGPGDDHKQWIYFQARKP